MSVGITTPIGEVCLIGTDRTQNVHPCRARHTLWFVSNNITQVNIGDIPSSGVGAQSGLLETRNTFSHSQ